MPLATLYAIFALIATLANLGAQEMVIRGYDGAFAVLLAMAAGTGVGLIVKYILDKRYIFRFRTRDLAHDGQTFALYTLMGLITTMIFWGCELGFDQLFASKPMRYLGGIIGLATGYFAKYQLDRRYVFRMENA